jgi:outer membrane lipoprotein LolB
MNGVTNTVAGAFRVALAFAMIFIAGCASNKPATGTFWPKNDFWQGKMTVKVYSAPLQSFSANFEITGTAQAGRMELGTAMGTTLARMQWDASGASLQSGGETRLFSSLDALTLETMGAELPAHALFDWLQGRQAQAPGWHSDLTQWEHGRLAAQRNFPEPRVELKIVLER